MIGGIIKNKLKCDRREQFISTKLRHSRAGGNPAKTYIPRSGQNEQLAAGFEVLPNRDVVPLRGEFFNHLDSRLRGNDEQMYYLSSHD